MSMMRLVGFVGKAMRRLGDSDDSRFGPRRRSRLTRRRHRLRPSVEGLEGRELLSSYTITSGADSASVPGSLRYELNLAVNDPTPTFNDQVSRINLTSGSIQLPSGTTFEGNNNSVYSSTSQPAFDLLSGPNSIVLEGTEFLNTPGTAVEVDSAAANVTNCIFINCGGAVSTGALDNKGYVAVNSSLFKSNPNGAVTDTGTLFIATGCAYENNTSQSASQGACFSGTIPASGGNILLGNSTFTGSSGAPVITSTTGATNAVVEIDQNTFSNNSAGIGRFSGVGVTTFDTNTVSGNNDTVAGPQMLFTGGQDVGVDYNKFTSNRQTGAVVRFNGVPGQSTWVDVYANMFDYNVAGSASSVALNGGTLAVYASAADTVNISRDTWYFNVVFGVGTCLYVGAVGQPTSAMNVYDDTCIYNSADSNAAGGGAGGAIYSSIGQSFVVDSSAFGENSAAISGTTEFGGTTTVVNYSVVAAQDAHYTGVNATDTPYDATFAAPGLYDGSDGNNQVLTDPMYPTTPVAHPNPYQYGNPDANRNPYGPESAPGANGVYA